MDQEANNHLQEMREEARDERRVLVAVDASNESSYALSWSLKNIVIQDSRDTLILLYVKYHVHEAFFTVVDTPGILDTPTPPVTAVIEKFSQTMADCIIERAKRLCKNLQHVKVETRVERGDPRNVICEMAEKLGAHVLVMGNYGYGIAKRTFLGSVSDYCSKNVKCPVLIVKNPDISNDMDE